MDSVVGRSTIFACMLEENGQTAGVSGGKLGEVVDVAVDGNPERGDGVVGRQFRGGEWLRHCEKIETN